MNTWSHPTAYSSWGPEEHAAIARVVNSGRFTMGAEVEAFEREFAGYHGKAHGIMVNSGSSANLVAVSALIHDDRYSLKAGDTALVPAVAWSTTYAPLVQHGLNLRLIDCDGTWNAAVGPMKQIGEDVGVIVACSILGSPAHLTAWRNLADHYGLPLLEDNCESLGASTEDGHRCGTVGDLSTFSFFWSHQISAIEGGMILTNDSELAKLCRMLRAHGWSRDVEAPKSFDLEYDFRLFGYNVRPLEMHAAIAREQLKKLDGFVAARSSNAESFWAAVQGLPVVLQEHGGHPSPFGLNFRVSDAPTRNRLASALRASGIDCRLPTGGSFRRHAYGKPWADQQTPRADELHVTGLFLGNGPFDMSQEIAAAVQVMRDTL